MSLTESSARIAPTITEPSADAPGEMLPLHGQRDHFDQPSPATPASRLIPMPIGKSASAPGDRLHGINSSAIIRIGAACRQMGGIDLATGIPSIPAHTDAVAGAVDALRGGQNAYAHPHGVAELRQAIVEKLRRENRIECDADSDVLVTSGAIGAFTASMMALFSPGDEILVPEPYFGWHVNLVRLAGLRPRFVRLHPPLFALTRDALTAALSPRTRGIVLCTPANPSGKVYTRDELKLLARVAFEQDLLVITDEQYEQFCYDSNRHVSPASIDGLDDRTVAIMGFSKSLSVTGWRLGYAVAPAALMKPIRSVHQLLYICPPTPLQHGVAHALRSPIDRTGELRAQLSAKRDRLCTALTDAGFAVLPPQGGFFVLATVPAVLARSMTARTGDLAMAVLEETGVAAVAGPDFYSNTVGDRILRFCFAKSDADIEEACRRLRTLSTRQ
ncbi:MAG: pyridoxal phosphate-dependent aminotransferase [Proteobacteria bacterium]|nr:pyridoxal phosphate-dependent aminotransferase [Pseudomonadota bacterium]